MERKWWSDHRNPLAARVPETAAVEPIEPPPAAPSRPVNFGLGDLVPVAVCHYPAVW
jgi:hypothetical protein